MTPFSELTAVAALLSRDDIDTDTIIPVPFLRKPKQDLARGLFHNLRFDAKGEERMDFILNRPGFSETGILVSGANFGCGSSREHAVWALLESGIRVVIAGSFGDIFHANCLRMGLLPIALAPDRLLKLSTSLADGPPRRLSVSLIHQRISGEDGGWTIDFTIDPLHREMMLKGLEMIDITITKMRDIDAFQRRDRKNRPWVYANGD